MLAFVTGAAKGIGRATVNGFLARGWRVAAIDRDDAVTRLQGREDQLTSFVADVTDQTAIAGVVEQLGEPAKALVNAAGIFPPTSLSTFSTEDYRRIFDVNILGTLLSSQAIARTMPSGGCIINLASTNGFVARADQLLYAATKAAVVSLTRSMAADLAPRDIRVNAVAPGAIDTEGVRELSGRLEEAAKQTPLGRVGSAAEIADLILWLVEGQGAGFITGETIVSSGGSLMR